MDCSLLGSSVHGVLLEWVAMPSSRGSSQLKDSTWVFRIADRVFTQGSPNVILSEVQNLASGASLVA